MSEAPQMDDDGLDPDIRRFVKSMQQAYGRFPDFDRLPMPARRKAAEQVRAPWREGGPAMWRSEDVSIEGVRGRIHRPVETPGLGAMLYLHGGGWTMFSIDTHDRLMREYAARAGVVVVGLDYSLSPEMKFPTALNEALKAVEWLRREGGDHGIDTSRLAIGGDSAGANLSVATALSMREMGRTPLSGLLLNYGAFNPEPGVSAALYDGPRYMLTLDEMDYFWRNYTLDATDLLNPLVAPALADVRGLPPALFCIAGCDILAIGNRAMAERFAAAKIPTEVHVYEGATHSFLEAVSISPLADRAIETAALWLRSRLAPSRAA